MSIEEIDLGRCLISPRRAVVAGSWASIRLVYTAGHPIDETGFLKIVFRYAGDFGEPQFAAPAEANFCTVSTDGDCRIEPRWDVKANTRPWGRTLMLKVMGGYLGSGKRVTVVFGDPSHGSPGWRMQTFCEPTFEFKTLVDPYATFQFKELPQSPVLRIKPGEPVRALCIAPSTVKVGARFTCHLKLEDRWGNPVRKPKSFRHPGFPRAGVDTVEATDGGSGLSAESNPVEVVEAGSRGKRFWGDLHGQSEETIGTNSVEEYFQFARDRALVDFAAHQGNDFQITDRFWKRLNKVTKQFNDTGRFVTFPGYEWSGNTPLGGDRNVWYAAEGGPISRSSRDLVPAGEAVDPDSPTAADLFARLKGQDGPRPFVFAHVGGRYADIRTHDPDLEWAVEVHSAWGTFEWLVADAMRFGYRVGICANSDGHKGRPGASYPGAGEFGSLGGLTCVFADSLRRSDLLKAFEARHFYGTTGNRSLLDVHAHTGDGREAMMGDIIDCGEGTPRLRVSANATGPVEQLEVRNGVDRVRRIFGAGASAAGRRVKVVWSGAQIRGRARMVSWDGGLRVRGNSIEKAEPLNFWNAEKPLRRVGRNGLAWESVTTGGVCGVILTLAKPGTGTIEVETAQKKVRLPVRAITRRGRTWKCGGLEKQLAVYRLPDTPGPRFCQCEIPLKELRAGDNPIYVRLTQEDGHMAWSSPIYLVK
jgi:hypothetical protein